MDRALAAALKALREPRAQAEAWARRLTQALGVVVKQVAAGGRGAAGEGRPSPSLQGLLESKLIEQACEALLLDL